MIDKITIPKKKLNNSGELPSNFGMSVAKNANIQKTNVTADKRGNQSTKGSFFRGLPLLLFLRNSFSVILAPFLKN